MLFYTTASYLHYNQDGLQQIAWIFQHHVHTSHLRTAAHSNQLRVVCAVLACRLCRWWCQMPGLMCC
jgi:hypothetical protein